MVTTTAATASAAHLRRAAKGLAACEKDQGHEQEPHEQQLLRVRHREETARESQREGPSATRAIVEAVREQHCHADPNNVSVSDISSRSYSQKFGYSAAIAAAMRPAVSPAIRRPAKATTTTVAVPIRQAMSCCSYVERRPTSAALGEGERPRRGVRRPGDDLSRAGGRARAR